MKGGSQWGGGYIGTAGGGVKKGGSEIESISVRVEEGGKEAWEGEGEGRGGQRHA